jgi:hypothetical protein
MLDFQENVAWCYKQSTRTYSDVIVTYVSLVARQYRKAEQSSQGTAARSKTSPGSNSGVTERTSTH